MSKKKIIVIIVSIVVVVALAVGGFLHTVGINQKILR